VKKYLASVPFTFAISLFVLIASACVSLYISQLGFLFLGIYSLLLGILRFFLKDSFAMRIRGILFDTLVYSMLGVAIIAVTISTRF
jgi:hypothetical protein